MRVAGIVAIGVVGALLAVAAASATPAGAGQGSNRPPGTLTSDQKAIWMSEWVPCWRVKLSTLSKRLHIPVRPGVTPQQVAARLAQRAVDLLYDTPEETQAAADGCRNGILWRFYHPEA